MIEVNKILTGDALTVLKTMPNECVNCCITSPPYFGLRDYGTAEWSGGNVECDHKQTTARHDAGRVNTNGFYGSSANDSDKGAINFKDSCKKCGATRIDSQLGLEQTPELYISKMVEVFSEVKRVLRNDGTLWVNIGDSYARIPQNETNIEKNAGFHKANGTSLTAGTARNKRQITGDLKPKDLIGIPWLLAFALRADGWYLRQDIIWHKPNPMPESVTDRCTKSHEYIFLLSKSAKYYYDNEAIKQIMTDSSFERLTQDVESQQGSERVPGKTNGRMKAVGGIIGGKKHKNLESNGQPNHTFHETRNRKGEEWSNESGKANKRSVWTVTTKPYSESHFATFPQDLIVDMIKAGCPENGIILDCFMGAGTTALVAAKLNRNYVGIELNPAYVRLAERRLRKELGMFNPSAA